MGSNSSKNQEDTSQHGQIYLKTDSTAYQAGETVTGNIYLDLISRYPGKQLFLKLKGKEVAHIVKTEDTGIGRRGYYTYDQRFSEQHDIIDQTTIVHSWNILSTGQFAIPFSVLLPPNLPPSFYQQGRRYLAFIEYELEVFLEPGQEKLPRLEYKQPINIREPIMPAPQSFVWDVTTQLKSCYCCNEGSNLFKVKLDKNNVSPGENMKISIKLENSETSLKNVAIVATLKQRLELRAGGRSKVKDFVKMRQELPGIPNGSKTPFETFNLTLPRFPAENDFKRGIDKMKPDTDELVALTENHQVMTSNTKNRLIYSEFYWEITCPMSGCDSTLPVFKYPIGVIRPDFKPRVVNPPKTWKPVVLDACVLAFFASQRPQNYEMVAGQKNMLSPQSQSNEEMVQIITPKKPHIEYKPDHFPVFSK